MGQATTGRKWGSERFIKLIIQLLDCNSYVCLSVCMEPVCIQFQDRSL